MAAHVTHPVRALIQGATVVALLALASGCGRPCKSVEPGYSDQSQLQVQFYSPPGAVVSVCENGIRSRQVGTYPPTGDRLERTPEQFAVFNLKPGRYEFKYTSAEGLEGVSIYGELNVHRPHSKQARIMQRRAFVPIALPSEHYRRADTTGDEIFPFRGESVRLAIDEMDLQRLSQGDVVEKVYFVADLAEADKLRDKLRKEIAVTERKIEYADARFRMAYLDFHMDVDDSSANFWGTDREFIEWEKERQELDRKLEKLTAQLRRTDDLLRGDRVIARQGMLVVATEQLVAPYEDTVEAADELGEVMLVMRIGGRHMHWGPSDPGVAAAE